MSKVLKILLVLFGLIALSGCGVLNWLGILPKGTLEISIKGVTGKIVTVDIGGPYENRTYSDDGQGISTSVKTTAGTYSLTARELPGYSASINASNADGSQITKGTGSIEVKGDKISTFKVTYSPITP
jgi:hypothetical protein